MIEYWLGYVAAATYPTLRSRRCPVVETSLPATTHMNLAQLLVRVAVVLLPTDVQERYRIEWRSEIAAVEREQGSGAAIGFAFRLLRAAPSMAMAMRQDSSRSDAV